MADANGSIKFVNASKFVASVYRGDAFVIDLAPGKSSTQDTAEGQVWIVKDKDTGRQVGTVTGTNKHQTYNIKFGRGRGGPESSGGGG
jgi:hypothetical protein